MIKRNEERDREVRERMRDGDGEVEIFHIFKKEELKGKARLLAHLTLRKNCSIGYHTHDNEEEVYYIVKGRGTVSEDGREYRVGPGDAVLTGGGAGHSIRNDEDEPLEVIAIILQYI